MTPEQQRAREEAMNAWRTIEQAARIFGMNRRDYCLDWIVNEYGSSLGLTLEDL